ncbi:MAG: flippase-like domain-containing protein [Kiritimatiellae bacterium]|nr:flippase-like domain-containing protein [Kiritimatiellia bacterium]
MSTTPATAPAKGNSKAKQWIGLILSLGISGAILGYLITHLDWALVSTYLGEVNLWYLPVAIVLLLGLGWMRAMRWKYLLPNREQLSVWRLFEATMIGFFANFVLPLRAGEFVRPWILSRWQPVSFSAALASILTERLSDAICLLTFLVLCLNQMASVPPVILAGAQALGVLSVVLIGIVIASYLLPGKVERLFHQLVSATIGRIAPALATRINGMIIEYFVGVRSIQSFRDLFMVMFWSFAMWGLMAGWYQILLLAFGEHPSLWVGMVLNVFVALAVAAPSAPGFLGTFQAGCIIALSTLYGYPKEFAMAYSVIGHAMQFIFNITIGLLILHAHGMKLGQLKDQKVSGGKEVSGVRTGIEFN